jgi:glycerophosphoryl diester phosphodiesterase
MLLHLLFRSRPVIEPAAIGHRGAAGLAPENTLAAIQTALNHGVTLIEVDLQRSVDGVLLLMHDETVDRTTDGAGPVRQLTWAEISQFDAGSDVLPGFAGEPVPTLETVLALLAPTEAILVIEVKNPEHYPGLEQQLAETIQKFEAQARVAVISFDHAWLDRFHRLQPDVLIGPLAYYPLSVPHISANQAVDILWVSVILDPTLIHRLHRQGYQVWVFTVNQPLLMRLLLWLGVDAIATDRPDLWVSK